MKRPLLFLLSAVAAGALTGYFVSGFDKNAPAAPKLSIGALLPSFANSTPAAPSAPETFVSNAVDAVTSFVGLRAPRDPNSVSVLLREPMVIMHGGEAPGVVLREGTRVDLVQNEGRFLRVRHDQSVVTVPRTAIVMGVARTH